MLHFFKKVQFLNYVFPIHQPHELSGNAEYDVDITEYNINESYNKDDVVDADEMQIDKIYRCS
ncbi:MAG: hypothetical protein ABIP37_00005 [Methylotenera sp.]